MYGFEIELPANMEFLNYYNSQRSVCGRVQNDVNTQYYMRALYQRIISGATFKLPNSWKRGERYFKNVLFQLGYIGVVKTSKYGVIPQIGAPRGFGVFLEPTYFMVNQPLVRFDGKIGKDCEIIHLTNDWRGVWDIVEHYAVRLAIAITSVDVSLFNSRISLLAGAKNKAASETLKYLYEKISAGEPFAVYDKKYLTEEFDDKEPIWTYSQDAKNQYITDKLLDDMNEILRQFDNEVGILAMPGKRERMITDEVTAMNDDACARASSWFNCLSESFDRVNELFPELNLSFTLKFGGEERVYNNENDVDRNV